MPGRSPGQARAAVFVLLLIQSLARGEYLGVSLKAIRPSRGQLLRPLFVFSSHTWGKGWSCAVVPGKAAYRLPRGHDRAQRWSGKWPRRGWGLDHKLL